MKMYLAIMRVWKPANTHYSVPLILGIHDGVVTTCM